MQVKTFEQYHAELFNSNDNYFGKPAIEKQLRNYESLLNGLKSNSVKPSEIVGKGLKNPRKYAFEYLAEGIAAYNRYLNGEPLPLTKSNYEYLLKHESEKLTIL